MSSCVIIIMAARTPFLLLLHLILLLLQLHRSLKTSAHANAAPASFMEELSAPCLPAQGDSFLADELDHDASTRTVDPPCALPLHAVLHEFTRSTVLSHDLRAFEILRHVAPPNMSLFHRIVCPDRSPPQASLPHLPRAFAYPQPSPSSASRIHSLLCACELLGCSRSDILQRMSHALAARAVARIPKAPGRAAAVLLQVPKCLISRICSLHGLARHASQ